MAKQQVHAVEAQAATQSDFTQLLEREFRPKTDQARAAVEHAVQTLAEQALTQSITISDDAYKSIAAIIAQIDRKLSEQINLILHHDDYQALESAWRGLNHLVSNTETDEHLKIRVMDVSKGELHRTMRRYKGLAWDQSPLFKQIYEQEYGQLGGEPYPRILGVTCADDGRGDGCRLRLHVASSESDRDARGPSRYGPRPSGALFVGRLCTAASGCGRTFRRA
ncbi:hypothetical protein C6T58_11095 [Burkholderia multivorans]|nr:hypothetical protein C6T58_11095 [Burkholderia multivorans]